MISQCNCLSVLYDVTGSCATSMHDLQYCYSSTFQRSPMDETRVW